MSQTHVILMTDMVDSTELTARLGDVAMAALWQAHDRLARDLLRDCLHSLGRLQAYTTVVDNASTDESAAMVEREFPAARLVRSAENLGYARANNAAALAAPPLPLAKSCCARSDRC